MDVLQQAREAYMKGVKVVNCCESIDHLDSARKFIENFWLNILKPSKGHKDEKFIEDYYNALGDIYAKRYKMINIKDSDVKEFLEWVDKPGPWSEEYDKIHTVGGLSNDKDKSFMKFQNKISKKKK
tara:strand:+ start:534 stop:911 length:378 start_codon:yes stop_codon:yes gene_type:complete